MATIPDLVAQDNQRYRCVKKKIRIIFIHFGDFSMSNLMMVGEPVIVIFLR